MADEKHVPLRDFVAVVKVLFSQINELSVSVMALRAALMQAQSVPVSPDELKRLDAFFHDFAPLKTARDAANQAMESLEASTSEDMTAAIAELLRKFEGPIQ